MTITPYISWRVGVKSWHLAFGIRVKVWLSPFRKPNGSQCSQSVRFSAVRWQSTVDSESSYPFSNRSCHMQCHIRSKAAWGTTPFKTFPLLLNTLRRWKIVRLSNFQHGGPIGPVHNGPFGIFCLNQLITKYPIGLLKIYFCRIKINVYTDNGLYLCQCDVNSSIFLLNSDKSDTSMIN